MTAPLFEVSFFVSLGLGLGCTLMVTVETIKVKLATVYKEWSTEWVAKRGTMVKRGGKNDPVKRGGYGLQMSVTLDSSDYSLVLVISSIVFSVSAEFLQMGPCTSI